MNTYGLDLMWRRRRRQHSAEVKTAVIQECMRPGVSIAAVAHAHSLNANMLRKWLIDAAQVAARPSTAPATTEPSLPAPTFIPLALTAPPVDADIRIFLPPFGLDADVTLRQVHAKGVVQQAGKR